MWKVVSPPFLNAGRIFPTKQRDVFRMVGHCSRDPNVRRALVFGSSVTPGCNPWSDIDMYFELDREAPLPGFASPTAAFDKWSNFSASGELLEEILKTGVTVYERE